MKSQRIVGCIVVGMVVALPALAQGVLLIPNSGTDSVWAFSPVDGALVQTDLIPDNDILGTPTTAIDSGWGTILVSDQISDGIFEYRYDGSYIGPLADASDGLDNVRGITVHHNQVYALVGGGTYDQTVQRFDMDGSNQTTWTTTQGSPWWLAFRDNDALISNSTNHDIDRYSLEGAFLGILVDGNTEDGPRFPRQIFERDNGNLLLAGFSIPSAIYEYDAGGDLIATYAPGFGQRGVWELENGKYLFTAGTRVATVDPHTGEVVDIVNQLGSSFQHISYSPLPEPGALTLLATGGMLLLRRR